MNTQQQAQIAAAFAHVINEWLTPEQLAKVNIDNVDAEGTCATGDYVDSNMAMDEAFTKVVGRDISLQSNDDCELWNASWNIANIMNFDTVLLDAYAETVFPCVS